MTIDRFEHIHLGDEEEITHVITREDVDSFVRLTGDNNPLHVDESYAAKTSFRKPVVHGMLTASFLSTMIGTRLPGQGSLWYEQDMRFLSPVRVGEKIRVWAKVRQKSLAQRVFVLDMAIFGEGNRRVIEGQAKVKIMDVKPSLPLREFIEDNTQQQQNDQSSSKNNLKSQTEKGAVIISGASRGIGAAIAKKLASKGFSVVVNYSQSESQAEEVVRVIQQNQGKAIKFRADIRNTHEIKKMVKSALSEFKTIMGIVNNASLNTENVDFKQLIWEDVQKHFDTQIKGAFDLTQAVLPHFLEKQQGIIVNITSICVDNVPPTKMLPYHIAKAGLVAFSKSLAAEYGPKGIRINCVAPGMTETDFIADFPEKSKMLTKMQTPLRRLATVEDTAGCVSFLFSDEASFITGQTLRVCGGIVME